MEITIDITSYVEQMDSYDIADFLKAIHDEDEDYIKDFVKDEMYPSDIWEIEEVIRDYGKDEVTEYIRDNYEPTEVYSEDSLIQYLESIGYSVKENVEEKEQ